MEKVLCPHPQTKFNQICHLPPTERERERLSTRTFELTQEERLELVESIVELSFSSPTNTTHPLQRRPDSFLTHHNQTQVRTQNP